MCLHTEIFEYYLIPMWYPLSIGNRDLIISTSHGDDLGEERGGDLRNSIQSKKISI